MCTEGLEVVSLYPRATELPYGLDLVYEARGLWDQHEKE